MKERDFALLLAALVMLLGTGATLWQKGRQEEEEMYTQSAAVQLQQENEAKEEEEILLPAFGTLEKEYGAVYSGEYAQWTLCPYTTWAVEGMAEVSAPLSGTVTGIEARAGGGSLVRIDCEDAVLEIFPIYNVRVFAGSRTARGEVLGNARDTLTLQAYRDGLPTDPRQLGKASSFEMSAGAGRSAVE